jgi:hypothetical protein
MISDRKRVEILVVLEALISIAIDGADPRHPDTVKAANLLHAAIMEAISGAPFERTLKLQERSKRTVRAMKAPYVDRSATVAAFGLAVYCLLRRLTDADYLVLAAGSDVDLALAALLPALEHAASDAALDRAAIDADRMLAQLHSDNLFTGMPAREVAHA